VFGSNLATYIFQPRTKIMETLLYDIRYGIRMLAKRPGSTVVVVVVLALGIGANSAIFSVVNAVLLRALPYPEPSRLVSLWERNRPRAFDRNVISPSNFLAWQDRSHTFEDFAAFYSFRMPAASTGDAEEVTVGYGTTNLMPMLGASPMLGRGFEPADVAPDAPNVVLLSHGYWQRRYGGDPGVVGRTIKLNGLPATVVGVLPPDFHFYVKENNLAGAEAEVWTPFGFDASDRQSKGRWMSAVGRLRPGVSLEQAQTEMNAIAADLAREQPDFDTDWDVALVPLADEMVGDIQQPLWLLFGAVAFVLFIACANVANLSLVRATVRHKEVVLRTAVGASRSRIVRQLMTEHLLLAVVGGALGLGLGVWGVDLLLALSPKDLLGLEHVALDARVVGFTAAVTLATSLVFGLAPAIEATRVDLNDAIRQGASRTGTGSHGRRTRDLFVVAQVALALVLLVGSGLLVRSLVRLQSVDPGFSPERLLTFHIRLPIASYKDNGKKIAFFEDALAKLDAIPGVRSASAVSFLPFDGGGAATTFTVEGAPPPAPGQAPVTDVRVVDPAYFATMGTLLVEGRTFTEREAREASGVVVINETMARAQFGGESPIGKRITIEMKDTNTPSTIVGVVGDVRLNNFEEPPRATAYWPIAELPYPFMTAVVRTDVEPASIAGAARREIASIDPEAPVSQVRTMDALLSDSVARSRFAALLLAVFAGVALLIAVVGVYGVVAYTVTQRRQEIGIRMALGATGADVLRLVVLGGMLPAAIGVAVGLVAALGLSRVMAGMLFGVSATDPATFATIAAALAAAALVACLAPALRATAVDPVEALRDE
jgi:putative ABC transport system permease protein